MDRMAKELDGRKKALKKATNKGGIKMTLEMSDINEALGKFLDAVGEVFTPMRPKRRRRRMKRRLRV